MDASSPPSPEISSPAPLQSGQEESHVTDISGNSWQLAQFSRTDGGEPSDRTDEGLFVYRNTYHLLPNSIGKLKTLKFFANEIEVLPAEIGEGLESVQIRVSSPKVSEVPFRKMKALKELELCKIPPRPSSAFSLLSEICNLKCLTKLTLCHFSIRYFPPEIGALKKLEQLDLSFNKLKNLPNCIAELSSLKLLKISNNKLVELPAEISQLKFLENLDLSNNRLTSVFPLELRSMVALQYLNLQLNRITFSCQIPPWICCDMRGNNEETQKDEKSARKNLTNYSSSGPVSLKIETIKRPTKTQWKRIEGPQQRAREERLNLSRNLKHEKKDKDKEKEKEKETEKEKEMEKEEKEVNMTEEEEMINIESPTESREKSPKKDEFEQLEEEFSSKSEMEKEVNMTEEEEVINIESPSNSHEKSPKKDEFEQQQEEYSSKSDLTSETSDDSSCVMFQDTACSTSKLNYHSDAELTVENNTNNSNPKSKPKFIPNSKRHPDGDGDGNPKPSKVRKPPNPNPNSSYKYSVESFCGVTDRLSDGFYDAGRDQPFMPLQDYENYLCLDSREIILLDREQDEELDSIVISAQLLLSSFKRPNNNYNNNNNNNDDNLQDESDVALKASLLALFVSDCFGGSDRSASLSRTRRAVVSLNKEQPFICTCNGINGNNGNWTDDAQSRRNEGIFGNPNFAELCDKSLRFIKERRNSNVVPLGDLQFGVCRHRALLMKYLCDRMDPPIPCELVRGYLDFMPHAWNAILVKKDGFWVRMVVDPCYPTNIREETDPEYFCRYIPLSRLNIQLEKQSASILGGSFPSLSSCREIDSSPARTLYHCKIGNVDTAVKVRYLDTRTATKEQIRNFEYRFLAEVRMLGALREHRGIVGIYGHQLSCKWVPLPDGSDGNKEYRLLQSVIVMEYLKGGSLKGYLDKLSKKGEKLVPINLSFHIAKQISLSLSHLHSKRIIHRDIKSENILLSSSAADPDSDPDPDSSSSSDGSESGAGAGAGAGAGVKLGDFDQSVPAESRAHGCCIAHVGVWPACCCVGTPRWMAPEVLRAMRKENPYGLEVDIWSYGCFLLELLTLQIPYQGLSDSEIYNHINMREGPRLTKELEDFYNLDQHVTRLKLGINSDSEADKLKILIKLFYRCLKGEPSDRPTAQQIYDSLCAI